MPRTALPSCVSPPTPSTVRLHPFIPPSSVDPACAPWPLLGSGHSQGSASHPHAGAGRGKHIPHCVSLPFMGCQGAEAAAPRPFPLCSLVFILISSPPPPHPTEPHPPAPLMLCRWKQGSPGAPAPLPALFPEAEPLEAVSTGQLPQGPAFLPFPQVGLRGDQDGLLQFPR